MDRIRVLVGAIGGGGHGEQIVKALRLAKSPYMIWGGDMSPVCPQFQFVDVPVLLPRATSPDYVDAVLDLCAENKIQAVFHGCEPELMALNKSRSRFAEAGIYLPINNERTLDLCSDKLETARVLERAGFRVPRSTLLTRELDVREIDKFPLVVKPRSGGGGSRDTFLVQDSDELRLMQEFLPLLREDFLIQEYVGDFRNEFTVGVLSFPDGSIVQSFALKRVMSGALNIRTSAINRTRRSDLGEVLVISSGVSQGIVDNFWDVRSQCEEVAQIVGSTGPLNVQCRYVDGKVVVFEINPRFSGTTSIRALLGYNEPDVLLGWALKGIRPPERPIFQYGTVMRSLSEYVIPERSFLKQTSSGTWSSVNV